MRFAAVIVMVALAVAGVFLPGVDPVEPDPRPGTENPPVAICPLVQVGEVRTRVSVLSSVNGEGRLTTFSAGSETGVVEFSTGRSGAVTIPASDAGAVSVAGGLVEMPSETTAAGSVIIGPESWAAEACADVPTGQSFIAGGSTASDSFFEIQLINPYAGEATVEMTVATEAGLESDERFDSVIVPPLSTIPLDLTQIIPGRANISVNLETTRGSILAFGRQNTDGRSAIWRAVEPGQDWWLPVPPGPGTKQMLIANSEASEIQYQVDLYGPEGLVESHASGVIGPRGRATVPLARETKDAIGLHVIATGPVVPTLKINSSQGLAATTASAVESPVWLLPGARMPSGGTGSIILFNPGIEPVTASVRSLGENSVTRDVALEPESVFVIRLDAAHGYRVEATGSVVALWTSQVDGAGTAAIGFPLQDG